MIPPTKREALSVLAELLDLSPDVRLGQLFADLGFLGEDQTGRSLGNLDDEMLLAVLDQHRGKLTARLSMGPSNALQPPPPSPTDAALPKCKEGAVKDSTIQRGVDSFRRGRALPAPFTGLSATAV